MKSKKTSYLSSLAEKLCAHMRLKYDRQTKANCFKRVFSEG
jgi:hypothetical protein